MALAPPTLPPRTDAPSPAPAAKSRLTDNSLIAWLTYRSSLLVLLLVTVLFFVVPLAVLLSHALTDGAAGVQRMLAEEQFPTVLLTTVILSFGDSAVALVLGASLAWFAHRLPRKRAWLGYLPLFPLLLPLVASVLGWIFVASPTAGYLNTLLRMLPWVDVDSGPLDVYSIPWMIIVSGLALSSFVFLFVRTSLSQMPGEVIDSAMSSGSGPIRTYWRIVVPLIRPGLLYGWLTAFLMGFGQFTVPLLLGAKEGIYVLTSAMYFHLHDYPVDTGLVAAYSLPVILVGIVMIVVQRLTLRNQDRFSALSGKGGAPLSTNGWFAQGMLLLYGIVAMLLPLSTIVIVSLQKRWSTEITWSNFTFDHYIAIFQTPALLSSVQNSLVFGAISAVFAVVIGYFIALTVYNRGKAPLFAGLQEFVSGIPVGIPAVIFGLALLMIALGPLQLYGSPITLIVLYTTITIPFATRLQLVALTGAGTNYMESAAASGAGVLRRTLRIQLPMIRPAIGYTIALVLVLATHEFSGSLLLRTSQMQVMGSMVYDLFAFGTLAEAAAMAVFMCIVTAVAVGFAVLVGGPGVLKQQAH